MACLVVLGVRFGGSSGSFGDRARALVGADSGSSAPGSGSVDDTRTRELVLSQANQFIIRINSYGPSDLDKESKMPGYVARVKELITPKLDVEFEQSVNLAESTVAQAGLERSAQLYASGADTIGTDSAVVLVTGVITQSYPDPKEEGRIEFEPQLFRYEVSLVKVDGTWLTDKFEPVVGEVEGEPTNGAPTDQPTVDPSAPATVDPSAAAASPQTARYARLVSGRRDAVVDATTTIGGCGFPAAADASTTACRTAPATLSAAARTLAVALRDAAAADAPPEAIADLVQGTRVAANNVISAVQALRPACVVTESSACTTQRTAITDSAANLRTALDGWEALG